MEKRKFYGIILGLACVMMFLPVAACDVRIEKSGPPDVCTNGEFSYTIKVYYEGNANYQFKVKDALPAGLTYVSSSDGGSFVGGAACWTFSGPGYYAPLYSDYHKWWNKTLTVTVRQTGAVSTIKNSAKVWYKAPGNSWTDETTSSWITTNFQPCYTEITKTAPERACVDCDLTYGIHVTYTGLNGQNVKAADVLPAGVTFISASDGGTHDAGTVTWNFGPVNNGWSKDLTLVVNPGSIGQLQNKAESSVTGTGGAISSTAVSNTVLSEIIPCTSSPEFPTMALPAAFIFGAVLVTGYLKRKEF